MGNLFIFSRFRSESVIAKQHDRSYISSDTETQLVIAYFNPPYHLEGTNTVRVFTHPRKFSFFLSFFLSFLSLLRASIFLSPFFSFFYSSFLLLNRNLHILSLFNSFFYHWFLLDYFFFLFILYVSMSQSFPFCDS